MNVSAELYAEVVRGVSGQEDEKKEFNQRLKEGHLTRDENSESHFCVYFAAYDHRAKKVFIGHHKKSGLWLFNGGHIDKDETPGEALVRETGEEWGDGNRITIPISPALLTITHIYRGNVPCKVHYDFWYFVPLQGQSFTPDPALQDKEFYEAGWKSIEEAKALVEEKNTLTALSKIEKIIA